MGAQAIQPPAMLEPAHAGSSPNTYWRLVWRRLQRDGAAISGLVLVVVIVLLALTAP